jgi:hypothetical protein
MDALLWYPRRPLKSSLHSLPPPLVNSRSENFPPPPRKSSPDGGGLERQRSPATAAFPPPRSALTGAFQRRPEAALPPRQLGPPSSSPPSWGRCYDHNFLRFFPIFDEKIGVFLRYQCYDQFLSKFSFVSSQKRQYFRKIFWRKYLRNHNIAP